MPVCSAAETGPTEGMVLTGRAVQPCVMVEQCASLQHSAEGPCIDVLAGRGGRHCHAQVTAVSTTQHNHAWRQDFRV